MRTRSEWFLAGDGARGGSLELTSADIHLRPPSSIGGGGDSTTGIGGCGSYRSHDDLTNYRNDNFIIDNNINSDFIVASSILSSSLSAFTAASTNVNNNNNSNLHQNYHTRQNNNNNNHFHHHQQRYHYDNDDHEHLHHSTHNHNHQNNGGVVMMIFTVLDMLF